MGLARKLENRLEQLVDGLSATLFRGGIHPVDLAGRLIRQADFLVADGPDGPFVPNRFVIRINPDDLAHGIDVADLETELANALSQTGAERGWGYPGPVEVLIITDPAVGSGTPGFEGVVVPGVQPVWGHLIDMRGGGAFELRGNRVIVGRAPAADITLRRPEVSRSHAMIYRQAGSVWVNDLGSVNGTKVNGAAVDGGPVRVRTGDQVEFGPATLSLRIVG